MSRRKSTHGVTLFPFLDVLVSAMGSLILLLLITSQHTPHRPDDLNPLAPPPAELHEVDDSAERLAQAAAEEERQREIQARLAEHRQALQKHEERSRTVLATWQSNLDALEQKNQDLMRKAIQIRQAVVVDAEDVSKSDAQRQKLAEMIAAAEQRNEATRQSEVELQKLAGDLLEKRQKIQEDLETQKVAMAIRKPVFQVIAHDGNSGTDRRPILIECRADGLTFVPEQVKVTAKDLSEFSPEHNPLLAGAQALITYWTLADAQKGEKNSRPYVLLIVRPGGTVGFYVARKFLESLNQEYGYELVPEQSAIKWPDADPDAVEVCRTAVERARQEARVFSRGIGSGFGSGGSRQSGSGPGSRGSTSEQIVGANGEFQLPEVEELRNASPRDSIDMLGPEWSRQRSRQNSSARSAPGNSSNNGLNGIDPTRPTGGALPGEPGAGDAGEFTPGEIVSGRPAMAGNSQSEGATGNGISPQKSATEENPYGTLRNRTSADSQGSSSNGFGHQPLGRSSDNSRKPDLPPLPVRDRGDEILQDGGSDRQWGRPGRSGAIGIEREIVLQLYADRIAIVDGPSVTLPENIGKGDFHEIVAAMIQTQAMNWGDPPQKFIWRPRLKIEIYPGGNQHYGRLKELTKHWGISAKAEQKLN